MATNSSKAQRLSTARVGTLSQLFWGDQCHKAIQVNGLVGSGPKPSWSRNNLTKAEISMIHKKNKSKKLTFWLIGIIFLYINILMSASSKFWQSPYCHHLCFLPSPLVCTPAAKVSVARGVGNTSRTLRASVQMHRPAAVNQNRMRGRTCIGFQSRKSVLSCDGHECLSTTQT